MSGIAVTFVVQAGGGSLTGSVATSDASGVARVGSWTMGTVAGLNTLVASSPGLAGSPLTFNATGRSGPAASIVRNSAETQSARAAAPVAALPSVRVRDHLGNGVGGVTVTFVVEAGGGSLAGATPVTDASGVATVSGWTLGSTAGFNSVSATAPGLSPVSFSAAATAGPATSVTALDGDDQTVLVGTLLPVPPTVKVTDAFGNPVNGVHVSFAIAAGGGSISGSEAVTDDEGVASVGGWMVGSTPGINALTATAAGVPEAVTFHATATEPTGPDVTAPTIVEMSVTPSSVDVSSADASVTFTARITDSGTGTRIAGVRQFDMKFTTPTGLERTCGAARPESGTSIDGIWRCVVTVPRGSVPGVWVANLAQAADSNSNYRHYLIDDMDAAGLAARFTVTSSGSDDQPPTIVALSVAPSAVDVTNSDAIVTFTARVTDSGSASTVAGVRQFGLTFLTANGLTRTCTGTLTSGSATDGIWTCPVTVAKGAAPGLWTVTSALTIDLNLNRLDLGTSDLRDSGFPFEFTVTSADADVTPPRIESMTMTPTSVDVTESDATVIFSARITDTGAGTNVSGVRQLGISFVTPNGLTRACFAATYSSGSAVDGVWNCVVTVPKGSAPGPWTITQIQTLDHNGNALRFSASSAAAAGFPTEFEVISR